MENSDVISKKSVFDDGEYVIYGTNGVCQITRTTKLDLENVPKDRLYYVLQPVNSPRGVIYTPVDNAEEKMRRILTKSEAMELVRQMPDISPLATANEKSLEILYKNCLKSFDRVDWIKLIKCIYFRREERSRQGKKNTAMDERYMHLAEESLYSELSLSLGIPKEEVENYIYPELFTTMGE